MDAKKMFINKKQEKLLMTLLIKDLFNAINRILTIRPEVTIDTAILQLWDIKKEILKINPNWKLGNKYFHYVYQVISLVDTLDLSDRTLLSEQRKIYQKIINITRIMRQADPIWSMNVNIITDFLSLNSKTIIPFEQMRLSEEERKIFLGAARQNRSLENSKDLSDSNKRFKKSTL
jgi:hypothetical protein